MSKEKKTRVAFYIRVSTVEQKEGFSFEMQEKALLEHVKRCDYKGWETRKEWHFLEQGSGANTDRKGLKKLMEMAKKREFDLVLVWKIDRISRSLQDLLGIFETLHKNGIGFASVKEDIDFSGHIGKLIFQIFGALAEFERSTIQMRTEEGKKMSALAGNYIGGSPPYAYERIKNIDKKGSKLRLIKKEGEIVRQIFDWFVYDKKTVAEIARELNKMGIPKSKSARKNVKHTKWTDLTVRNILVNDIYRGIYIANRYLQVSKKPKRYIERDEKEWIPNAIEGVVNNTLFFQAQERLKYGTRGVRGGGKELYMLKGKLVDVATGKGFVGYQAGKGTKNYRRKLFTDKTGVYHATISISGKKLEDFVWGQVKMALSKPKRFLDMHKKNSKDTQKKEAIEERYTIYRNAYSKANERLDKVDRDYYDGNIEDKRRNELKIQYEKERDQNFEQMKKLERELKGLSEYEVACEDLKSVAKNMNEVDNLSYEEKTNIVRMLVEKVEIDDKEEERVVRVSLRFDQKAVTSAIPMGRTDLVYKQAKNAEKATDILFGGGR